MQAAIQTSGHTSDSFIRRAAGLAAVAVCAIALASCTTSRTMTPVTTMNDTESIAAGSEVNLASLTQVIQANPNDASAYNVRGSAYGRAGRFREAVADFDTAIRLDPNFHQAYANRALVQRRLGQDDKAFADYTQAIQINPAYSVAYVGRGNMYRARRQFDLALADFNRAIDLDGNDPRAFHNRGLIYQAQSQHTMAVEDFSKAIALAPAAPEPFNARGLSYLAQSDYKTALDDFNEVVKRDKDSFEGWTNQALALERLGEIQKAFAAFARAHNLNPNYRPAADGMRRTSTAGGVAYSQG